MIVPKIIKEKAKSNANNYVIAGKKLTQKELEKAIDSAEKTTIISLDDFNKKCEKLKNSI